VDGVVKRWGGGPHDSGPEVECAIDRIINTWVFAVTGRYEVRQLHQETPGMRTDM